MANLIAHVVACGRCLEKKQDSQPTDSNDLPVRQPKFPGKILPKKNLNIALMEKLTGYCGVVAGMEKDNVHVRYHDHEYGFPIDDDNELFARLILEINQAGLSWTTILNKKENFYKAYSQFDVVKVARYQQKQRDRLLQDAGIIRNRLKIDAAIDNAKKILEIQKEFGTFKKWIDHHHPLAKEEWIKLFKKTFRFTGGEIVNEFLVSSGYLPGAHDSRCPIYSKVMKRSPAWAKKSA